MTTNEEIIEVNAGVSTVFRQWTQVDTYRYFLDGVLSVTRTGPTTTHWTVVDGRASREFDADVAEAGDGTRFTWRSTSGPTHQGTVTLYEIDRVTTRVRLQTDIEGRRSDPVAPIPPGSGRRAPGDLDRFKDYIEASGDETGAWQGFVDRG